MPKRARNDPVAARRSEATACGKATKAKVVSAPTRSSSRLSNVSPPDLSSARELVATTTRSSPRLAASKMGGAVILQDRRQHKKAAGRTKDPPKAPVIKIKPRVASSMEVTAAAPVPKSNTATINTAVASSSARPVGILSSLATVLCANEDMEDAPRDDLISPRIEEVVPALFSLKPGVSGVLDGGTDGDKAQPEAEILEKHDN